MMTINKQSMLETIDWAEAYIKDTAVEDYKKDKVNQVMSELFAMIDEVWEEDKVLNKYPGTSLTIIKCILPIIRNIVEEIK